MGKEGSRERDLKSGNYGEIQRRSTGGGGKIKEEKGRAEVGGEGHWSTRRENYGSVDHAPEKEKNDLTVRGGRMGRGKQGGQQRRRR